MNTNAQSRCRICHHPLSDPVSVKIGMGPVCRGKENKQGIFDFMHAKIELLKHEKGKYIFVRDIGHISGRSVTNDTDYIVGQLYLEFDITDKTRIFYEDSAGNIDEILHSGRKAGRIKTGHEGIEFNGAIE